MSFKININSHKKNIKNSISKVETLATDIENKSVQIKNQGNDTYYYKLSSNQNNIDKISYPKIVFNEEKNKWIITK
jgi:hypothetical protein